MQTPRSEPKTLSTLPEEIACVDELCPVDLAHESIWISYCPMPFESGEIKLGEFNSHHRRATPVSAWEELKIGCGTPPILTPHGWMILYHGICLICYHPRESPIHLKSGGNHSGYRAAPAHKMGSSLHCGHGFPRFMRPRGMPMVLFPRGGK